MFSAYSDRSASCHTTGATVTAPEPAEEATMSIETSIGLGTGQPYPYRRTELVEPDWTRFPGWRDVTAEDWASAQWQRAHCVRTSSSCAS